MAEYIKREVVINRIKEYALDVYSIDLDDAKQFSGNSKAENYCEGLYEATELIDDIPAADVAPARHAHRVDNGGFYYSCSECGGSLTYGGNYCPNCGAKMDGGDEDAACIPDGDPG